MSTDRSPAEWAPLHRPKARWTPDEDDALVRAVEEQVAQNWNAIAVSLPGRTGKQCRERWMAKLSPAYRATVWTSEEDETLAQLQAQHGNQWARFRTHFPHRSTVSIKNRWVSLTRKQRREAGYLPTPTSICETPILSIDDDPLGFFNFESQFRFEELPWAM
jgi:hypothetical protein